jgi:hypothetical protein
MRSIHSSYLARYLFLNTAGISDHLVFPSRAIANAPPVFDFDTDDDRRATIAESFRTAQTTSGEDPIGHLFAKTGTVALLVIQGDRLLIERYGERLRAGVDVHIVFCGEIGDLGADRHCARGTTDSCTR